MDRITPSYDYLKFKQQLSTGELQAVAATQKEVTTESWAQILAVSAVLGLAILGDEPESNEPRLAAEWKANHLKAQVESPEVDADPEKAVGFASDVLFVDTLGQIRHKESRKGLLSTKARKQLYIQLISLDSTQDLDRATERDILLQLNQDLDARSQTNEQGRTVIEDFQDQYNQDFTVFWQGAYVIRFPNGTKKVTQLTIEGDFGPISPDYVAQNFTPQINAGIPLVEAAAQFGGKFFIVTENGDKIGIDASQAYELIVKKTLPDTMLQQFIELPGKKIEPLLESDDFLDYWMVEINAHLSFNQGL